MPVVEAGSSRRSFSRLLMVPTRILCSVLRIHMHYSPAITRQSTSDGGVFRANGVDTCIPYVFRRDYSR